MAYICDKMTVIFLSVFILTLVLQISALIFTFYIIIRHQFNRLWFLTGFLFIVRIASELIVVTGASEIHGTTLLFLHEWIQPLFMSGFILFVLHWFNKALKKENITSSNISKLNKRYYNIFNGAEISLTEEDIGEIRKELKEITASGVSPDGVKEYLEKNRGKAVELASKIRILDVNDCTLFLFKAPSKEFMIKNYASTFTDESLSIFIDLIAALAKGEKNIKRETPLKTFDGRVFQAQIKVSLKGAADEDIIVVSVIDITEYRRLEESLIKERDLAQKYLDIAEVVIVVYDNKGVIKQINRKGKELFGYSEEELVGHNWFDTVILPGDRGWLKEKYRKIMEGNLPYNPFYEENLLTKNGKIVRIAWRAVPLYDKDGKIESYLCSGIDVTELRKKEDELKRSEFRTLAVEKLAKIGYWEVNFSENKNFWSEENYNLLGVSPDETEPSVELFESLVFPEDLPGLRAKFDKSVLEKREYVHRYRLNVKGKVKYISEWAHHFFDENGQHIITTGLSQDITEQVLTANELEKSLKEKDALLRELHHRTKNNMQVISAMLNLKAGEEQDIRVSSVFLEVDRKIQSMALAHEKLYKSEDLSHIDFKEYFADLVSLLEESYGIKGKGIRITQDIEEIEGLIDIAVPCGLILNELITNSVKYAFPSGRKGQIHISLKKDSARLIVLSVSDDGIGMEEIPDEEIFGSLGIRTITALGKGQLHGSVEWNTENGVTCTVRFKDDIYARRI